jgi:hypothetical protein
MPVIVWKQAAVAPFIEKNHLGLTIGSLDEIDGLLANLSDDEIKDMLVHVNNMGVLLRDGYFTNRVLATAEQQAFVGDINFQ